jgi:hypothetical protein
LRVIPVATDRREMFRRFPFGRIASTAARRYARFAARTSLSIPVPPVTNRRAIGRRSRSSEFSVPWSAVVGFSRKGCNRTDLGNGHAECERHANVNGWRIGPIRHGAAYRRSDR